MHSAHRQQYFIFINRFVFDEGSFSSFISKYYFIIWRNSIH